MDRNPRLKGRIRDDERDRDSSERRFVAARDDNDDDGIEDSWDDDREFSRQQSPRHLSTTNPEPRQDERHEPQDWQSFGDEGGGGSSYYSGDPPYQRGDERILQDVREALEDHPEVDAADIEIMVRNGELTLTGIVSERRIKRWAEDCAVRVRGITTVHNQIRVGSSGGATPVNASGSYANNKDRGRTKDTPLHP